MKGLSGEPSEGAADRANTSLIPSNARLDYWGRDWVCDRGYRKSGPRCVPVSVPENAQLDYWGRDWVCQRGFVRVDSRCAPD